MMVWILWLLVTAGYVSGETTRLVNSFQRYNDSLTGLVYIKTDQLPDTISEFTVCAWVKMADVQNNNAAAADGLRIFTMQLAGIYNAFDLHVENSAPYTQLTAYTSSTDNDPLSLDVSELHLKEWFHVCTRWSKILSGTVAISVMMPDGTYKTANRSGMRTVDYDNSGQAGSVLLFHEQDDGLPVGSVDARQALRGDISSFQLSRYYLSDSELAKIGCGVRADWFDSDYDLFTREGFLQTSMIEQPSCTPHNAPGKWIKYANPVSFDGTTFTIHRNVEVRQLEQEVLSNVRRVMSCLYICTKKIGCHSVTYNEGKFECRLILGDIFDSPSGVIPLWESAGTDLYTGHHVIL